MGLEWTDGSQLCDVDYTQMTLCYWIVETSHETEAVENEGRAVDECWKLQNDGLK